MEGIASVLGLEGEATFADSQAKRDRYKSEKGAKGDRYKLSWATACGNPVSA